MNTCKNCNTPIDGNFCSNCGKPASLKRIDGGYIFREIANFFYAEKGWLYTTRRLFATPGESVRQYLTEERSRFIKPITFLIITSLIYTLIVHFFHFDAETFQAQISVDSDPEMQNMGLRITNWIIDNNGYAHIIIGFLMAFWLKLFFKKSGYNLFEFFVLICFLTGITSLLSSVIFIIQGVTNLNLIYIEILITTTYNIWAIAHFFDKKKTGNYIKAFLTYLMGMFSIGIIVTFILFFAMIFKQ